jgi:hypothetical protein
MLPRRGRIRNEALVSLFIAHGVLSLRQHRLVCEEHPDRPWRGTSQRADACYCVRVGMPCECNPCGGIDEPPAISPIARVTVDKNGPRH